MSNTDRVTRITNDLNVISSLIPGSTLSTSTMTIVDHNAWSGSFWRTYARENRTETIIHIKRIFSEAVSILKINFQDREMDYYKDIIVSVETAITGVISLKDTYKGDYYTISEIESIVAAIQKDLEIICSPLTMNSLFNETSSDPFTKNNIILNSYENGTETSMTEDIDTTCHYEVNADTLTSYNEARDSGSSNTEILNSLYDARDSESPINETLNSLYEARSSESSTNENAPPEMDSNARREAIKARIAELERRRELVKTSNNEDTHSEMDSNERRESIKAKRAELERRRERIEARRRSRTNDDF